jgi:hypothetical protein
MSYPTTPFDYEPTLDFRDRNMTSNLDNLLDEEALVLVKNIDASDLERTFGEREQDYQRGDYDYDVKGYTQPYWYFKSINDEVVGIGFRYGEARAVGKNVTPERLSRFVKLVRQKINIAFECIHSTPELNPDDIPLREV